MDQPTKDRWAVWTDGGTGCAMGGTAGPATWVYRLADGSYLTAGPDGEGGVREHRSLTRPRDSDGFDIGPAWHRIDMRLPDGPATRALAAALAACGDRPDRDLLWRLAAAVGAHADAPALLIADEVKVEVGQEWPGAPVKRRGVKVQVDFYL